METKKHKMKHIAIDAIFKSSVDFIKEKGMEPNTVILNPKDYEDIKLSYYTFATNLSDNIVNFKVQGMDVLQSKTIEQGEFKLGYLI